MISGWQHSTGLLYSEIEIPVSGYDKFIFNATHVENFKLYFDSVNQTVQEGEYEYNISEVSIITLYQGAGFTSISYSLE